MTKKTDNEREVNLLDYWNVVWSRRRVVISTFAAGAALAAVLSLFIPNTYRAKAVITPVSSRESGVESKLSSLAQQFGGLPGLSLPESGSSAEIVSLLNSNILRKKVLEREGSMRLLFPERWDAKRGAWESREWGSFFLIRPFALAGEGLKPRASVAGPSPGGSPDNNAPTVWEGIRELLDIVSVTPNAKENTITVAVDASTPEASALMVESFLDTLNEHMSGEAQRVARINRKYLEEQLWA
ncbi:MAG: Wzz/FepE/Etk N-terminal domain-containing protein, partial [Deltaproteobacteria bacterium]|nr:Wzz/FepE/Etk N-terminal domain-containing protein [Deltaproteobacteria bacterium]